MNKREQPLVSIIMSVYNDERYVAEAIESILSQTYKNIEFIIINDASKDSSKTIIKEYDDPRIRYFENDTNRKLAYSLNRAIEKSTGKYIARMDADDISVPDRIQRQVGFLEENENIDVVGSFAKTFGKYETILRYPVDHEEIKTELLFKNALCHPAVMFRKDTLDQMYDERLSASQDYELWARLIWTKTFYNIPEVLLNYRVHANQTRNINGVQQKAGAIAARRAMLNHLTSSFNNDSLSIFDEMFLVGKQRTLQELKQIEDVLNQLYLRNKEDKVFPDKCFKEQCAKIYFDNWYWSLGKCEVGIKAIKTSGFSDYYANQSMKLKLKAYIKYLQNFCEKNNDN
ncbi:glycosyltransferase family 2 protein [Enterococcus dongliensis]|uniref:glycosyltransferase family 2 protein n=1 Tax=Enterococcus dongliensis TaxID=2559925 RepID=UPI00288D6DE3|nr:glycosyltransferase [Enterococcus dongliensis]MDT2712390.1 glycosyltransferase [Enterococcus dongliensis]